MASMNSSGDRCVVAKPNRAPLAKRKRLVLNSLRSIDKKNNFFKQKKSSHLFVLFSTFRVVLLGREESKCVGARVFFLIRDTLHKVKVESKDI
jgi:hypothetical protein